MESEEPANLKIAMPTGTLELPARGEEHLVVTQREWKRLRAQIDGLRSAKRDFTAIAWAAVGVTVSAIFGALAWFPTYAALDDAQKLHFSWIGPATIGLGVLGLVTAVLMFFAASRAQQDITAGVDQIIADMDAMPRTPVG